ncbi:hypothetical protein ACFLYN_02510 [Chloroflexota bacterium]
MDGKKERFHRVATRRTNEVLKKLAILGNCANRSAYEYTEDEVNKIFSEIEREVKTTRMRFRIAQNNKKEFKL